MISGCRSQNYSGRLLPRLCPSRIAHESKLERQLNELKEIVRRQGLLISTPVYLRDGAPIPDGIDVGRIVYIKRVLIDPLEREEERLPEVSENTAVLSESDKGFDRPIMYPKLSIV